MSHVERTIESLRPRRLAHRGVIAAAGCWLDVRLMSEAEARRRILARWSTGTMVFRVADGLLVRFPSIERINVNEAIGAPLTLNGTVLLAAPLDDDELKIIAPAPNSVVLIRGGKVMVEWLSDGQREVVEMWLDVSSFALREVRSLAAPPAPPRLVVEEIPFNPREKFAGVPKADVKLASVIEALSNKQSSTNSPSAATASAAEVIRNTTAAAKKIAGSFLSRLRRMFAAPAQSGASESRGSSAFNPSGARAESWLSRLSVRFNHLLARLLLTSRLAQLIGRQQAKYLARMMEMFERGDLNEALRHAIPLSNDVTEGLQKISLGVPSPRSSLSISPFRSRTGSSIGVGELMTDLRRMYRAAFDRLAAQGKIEEAAFVLAELLQADNEAVAFLERHGKLQLAAEMAEARHLPPGLIARQWFIAGNRERAVAIAKRTKAFADAVMRLEKTDRAQAEVLRLLWADSLAESGDYVAAVEAIWPVEKGRRLALHWMDQSIEIGGAAGARMLARKILLLPEAFDELRNHALVLLDDEDHEQSAARAAFAVELRFNSSTPQTRTLARAAARALVRDASSGATHLSPHQFNQLISFSGDHALKTDIAALPANTLERLGQRNQPLFINLAEHDIGTTTIADAALLPNGHAVVALGEAGVLLLSREGRRIAHFDVPAHHLVMSDHGDRAIVLAKRGESKKLSRIDFTTRKADAWCDARVDAFAPDYDGALWFASDDKSFFVIDANAKRFESLWQLSDLDYGTVDKIARSATSCRLLMSNWGTEEWNYELPLMRLRSRVNVPLPEQDANIYLKYAYAVSTEGVVAEQSLLMKADGNPPVVIPIPDAFLCLTADGSIKHKLVIGDEHCRFGTPAIAGNWVAAPVFDESHLRVIVVDVAEGRIRAELTLARSKEVSLRIINLNRQPALIVADDCGRLLTLNLTDGRLLRNLRV